MGHRRRRRAASSRFQSPSLRGSGRFAPTLRCGPADCPRFNPLHCGAVVASVEIGPRCGRGSPVSIPFIAGQWSLPPHSPHGGGARRTFQSPSLRGSGRFFALTSPETSASWLFQSPSLRGSGRFRVSTPSSTPGTLRVSIPFIAGQWSLPPGGAVGDRQDVSFQSPSLRGSGRFTTHLVGCGDVDDMFQSPSLRGSGRFRAKRLEQQIEALVSIPFIAGQWSLQAIAGEVGVPLIVFQSPSLRGSGRFLLSWRWRRCSPPRFNPLHCGAVVASPRRGGASRLHFRVSIPFIAGQWSLRGGATMTLRRSLRVSIPFIAGQWSLHPLGDSRAGADDGFQSPSLRGSGRFRFGP